MKKGAAAALLAVQGLSMAMSGSAVAQDAYPSKLVTLVVGADADEALRDGVFRQDLFHGDIHIEEISNRVLVFDAIKPPQHDASLGLLLGSCVTQSRTQLLQQLFEMLSTRTRLVFGRHLASLHSIQDLAPSFKDG